LGGQPILTSSAKSKGRRCQDKVRDALRKLGTEFGVDPLDISAAIMGTSGCDILFAGTARKMFNLAIECKAVEALNVFTTFVNHFRTYESSPATKLLVHTKNRSLTLVTMRFEDFLDMYRVYVAHKQKEQSELGITAG
jgi:hypothetical protein